MKIATAERLHADLAEAIETSGDPQIVRLAKGLRRQLEMWVCAARVRMSAERRGAHESQQSS